MSLVDLYQRKVKESFFIQKWRTLGVPSRKKKQLKEKICMGKYNVDYLAPPEFSPLYNGWNKIITSTDAVFNRCKRNTQGKYKVEIRFLYFTENGKILLLADSKIGHRYIFKYLEQLLRKHTKWYTPKLYK